MAFINPSVFAAMQNPRTGQAFAPMLQQLGQMGQQAQQQRRQDQLIADQRAREDAQQAEAMELRQIGARAASIRNLPDLASKRSALMTMRSQAQDPEDISAIDEMLAMDEASLNRDLDEDIALASGKIGIQQGRQGFASAKTETYPNGTVLQALPTGETQVVAPDGRVITDPAERVKVLNAAEESLIARKRKGAEAGVLGASSERANAAKAASARASQEAKNIADKGAAADTEEQKALGKLRGEIGAQETNAWRAAKSQSLPLRQLESALKAAETGKYAQAKTFLGKYAPGVDVSNEQALQSIITSYALQELQKQSGPKTDFDFIKAAETQIQSGNTKAANEIILARMKENQRYAEERWTSWREFKKGGGNAEDFEDHFSFEVSEPDVAPTPQAQAAPQAAIDMLRNNPALAEQFKSKYGYLPEGF